MPYGSGSYGAVAYAGAATAPPIVLAGFLDVDLLLADALMISLPAELETWNRERSQRFNVDIVTWANLAKYPAVVPPPGPFSDLGPTGPTD